MRDEFYVHARRGMAEWLLNLVDDNESVRREAAKVVLYSFYMPGELIIQEGTKPEDFIAPFQKEVRRIVHEPEFPAVDYVQKLFTLSLALESDRMEQGRAKNDEEDRWHKAQEAKLGEHPTPAEVRRYLRRTMVRICREFKEIESEVMEEAFETGMAILRVIEALGEELLPAAPLIRHMLHETHQSYIASEAICRMGRASVEFYPDLIKGLEREDWNRHFSKPLGILLRVFPERISEVLGFLSADRQVVRVNAIAALSCCGRETLRHHPEVESRLLLHIRGCGGEEWHACAAALGEVGITSEAVTLLLEATYPANGDRVATAISSLGQMAREPERVVPRLVELLKDFNEPDPDCCYDGDQSRIAEALKSFGADAVSAVPALVDHIWGKPQAYYKENGELAERPQPDESVIRLLGTFGPLAASALPVLNDMKREMVRRCMEERAASAEGQAEERFDEADFCPEYLREAIERIGGEGAPGLANSR